MAPTRVRNRQPIPKEDVPPKHPWVCMQPHCRKFRWGYHSAGLLRDHQKSRQHQTGGPCEDPQCTLCQPTISLTGGAGLAVLAVAAADTVVGDTDAVVANSELDPAAMDCDTVCSSSQAGRSHPPLFAPLQDHEDHDEQPQDSPSAAGNEV